MLHIKTYYDITKLEELWNLVYDGSVYKSPFQSYDYVSRTLKYYFPYYIIERCYPIIVVIFRNETPIFIAPLIKHLSGKLELLGKHTGYNFCTFLCSVQSLYHRCIDLIISHLGEIDLFKIRQGDELLEYSSNTFNGVRNCVKIEFSDSYEKYYSCLSKSVRQNIRTAYNRISRDNVSVELCLLVGGGMSRHECILFDEIMSVYAARHESRYGVKSSRLRNFFLRYFNYATVNYLKCFYARTFTLLIDGHVSAFMSGMIDADKLIVPRLSINNRYAAYSPGVLLINEVIKYLISNTTCRMLDLSFGEEDYKYKMGGTVYTAYNFTLK